MTVHVGEPGAPVACFGYKPKNPDADDKVNFDARCSRDDATPDDQLRFEWDFQSDGVIDSTEIHPQHVYGAAGTFTVTLRVTDTGGNSDVLRRDVVVRPAK